MSGYFPADFWYSFYDGKREDVNENGGKWIELDAPIDFIPLHVRGGHILPTQEPGNTTEASRKKPFGLIVAPNEQNEAKGDLFYDDGQEQLSEKKYHFATFILKDNVLKMNVEVNKYDDMKQKTLDKIRIFVKVNDDFKKNIKFYVNGKRVDVNAVKIQFKANEIILTDLNLPMNSNFKLEWSFNDFDDSKTIIDCSLQNQALNKTECEKKSCSYNGDSFFATTRCFVPETKGGYKITQDSNPYKLEKNEGFSLLGNEAKYIQELSVTVSHKMVAKSKNKLTNIKVR